MKYLLFLSTTEYKNIILHHFQKDTFLANNGNYFPKLDFIAAFMYNFL